MNKSAIALISVLCVVVILTTSASARPTDTQLSRQKRQSDQRLAELETLLALQKYNRHRFRTDRKKGVGDGDNPPPGYGIIDFRMLGRKKKSTRYSPGELENSVEDLPRVNHRVPQQQQQEEREREIWLLPGNENKIYPSSSEEQQQNLDDQEVIRETGNARIVPLSLIPEK